MCNNSSTFSYTALPITVRHAHLSKVTVFQRNLFLLVLVFTRCKKGLQSAQHFQALFSKLRLVLKAFRASLLKLCQIPLNVLMLYKVMHQVVPSTCIDCCRSVLVRVRKNALLYFSVFSSPKGILPPAMNPMRRGLLRPSPHPPLILLSTLENNSQFMLKYL